MGARHILATFNVFRPGKEKISEMLDPYLQKLEELQYIVNFWIHYFFFDLFRATFRYMYVKRWYRGKVAGIVC